MVILGFFTPAFLGEQVQKLPYQLVFSISLSRDMLLLILDLKYVNSLTVLNWYSLTIWLPVLGNLFFESDNDSEICACIDKTIRKIFKV